MSDPQPLDPGLRGIVVRSGKKLEGDGCGNDESWCQFLQQVQTTDLA